MSRLLFIIAVVALAFISGGKLGSTLTERNLCRATTAEDLTFVCEKWWVKGDKPPTLPLPPKFK